LIAHEKTNPEGKGDKIAEGGPEVEEKDRRQKHSRRGLQPSFPEKGREGFPEIVEDDGDGEKKAGKEGQFEQGEKSFGNPVRDQVFLKGTVEMTEEFLGKWKESQAQQDYGSEDRKESLSQVAKRLEELFPFDVHPDFFSEQDTGSNVT
jgi:hypothetical protein